MQTKIVQVMDLQRDRSNIHEAARILHDGGLVVLPTETVYGIGANATDAEAVAGIFRAKGRPQDNPLIVHVCSPQDIEPLVKVFTPQAKALAERFWPGPLTIILQKSDVIPDIVSAGLDTVAIRIPEHPVARAIIAHSGVPVAAPSANISGGPSPTSAQHCIADLNGRVDMIVDSGICAVGVESTVVYLAGDKPRLLRPGAVTLEQLRQVLGEVELDDSVLEQATESSTPLSPGQKYKHYAPAADIAIIHGNFEQYVEYVFSLPCEDNVFALVFDEDMPLLNMPRVTYGSRDNPVVQARRLFAALRELDSLGAERVYARAPSVSGVGLAVYNRLLRAASFEEIHL